MSELRACERCCARSWLLARLASHLEPVRSRIESLLRLGDAELIAAVGGEQCEVLSSELARFDPRTALARCESLQLESICGCDPGYPPRLAELDGRPAVLYVAGGLDRFLSSVAEDPVAIVGARRASPYGLDVARSLARGLGAAGLTVVSGMALGIDSAAHSGALDGGARTIAVLPSGLDRPYPRSSRGLYRRIRAGGVAVSELPPGTGVWRWMFPARNRIIAGLSAMTVLVEARYGSGSLITVAKARELGRLVGAVPGRVTSSLATAPNELIARGDAIVRGPKDVLDSLFGLDAQTAPVDRRAPLSPELSAVLEGISDGEDSTAALTGHGFDADEGLALLASLELGGYVRREAGGRYSVLP
jgi:DNA processing protein